MKQKFDRLRRQYRVQATGVHVGSTQNIQIARRTYKDTDNTSDKEREIFGLCTTEKFLHDLSDYLYHKSYRTEYIPVTVIFLITRDRINLYLHRDLKNLCVRRILYSQMHTNIPGSR